MVKLSLSKLEEAVRNPATYRERLMSRGSAVSFYPPSYYVQLRNAVFKFHSSGNIVVKGGEYLSSRLAKFKNESRKQDMYGQYDWYVTQYFNSGLIEFDIRRNVLIQASHGELVLTGEVSRLDIRPNGGYAAWLFRSKEPKDWFRELRMPLIQNELSRMLNGRLDEISIGIFSFEEKYVDQRHFCERDVIDAERAIEDLASQLGPA